MRFGNGVITLDLPDALADMGMEATEQGGILLGKAGCVHEFTVPGPLDLRLPDLFMLLDPCHEERMNASDLVYMGFWHSHPPGMPSEYSPEDLLDWRHGAAMMFDQLPRHSFIYYPIATGDRLRVWALARDLTLTELEVM